MYLRKRIWKKSYFEPKLLERIIFYHFFTTKQTLNQKFWNVSVFERNFNNSNSSNLESKLVEHVRFRTKTSYYPSEFESNILKCLRFWRNIFCGKLKFIAKIALKKQFLWIVSHCKNNTVGTFVLYWKARFGFFFVKKKEHFYQSNFSSSFTFWNKILKTRLILGQNFWTCHILNQFF